MTAKKPTLAEQHAEVQKYRTSLESLQAIGRAMLGNPSLEDADGIAFQNQVEDVLETAGHEDQLSAVDGVVEPAAKIELITQDVIQPQLQSVAKIEEALAEKIANDTPAHYATGVEMTAAQNVNNQDDPPAPTLEALRISAESIGMFHDGLQLAKIAHQNGVGLEALRGAALPLLRRAPDITTHLGISLEELEETQVLGDLTDAVDRVGDVVAQAREVAEQAVQAAEAANSEEQNNGEGGDFTDALFAKTRGEQQSGTQVDEGTNVSSTSSDGTGGTDGGDGGDAGAGDGTDGLGDGSGDGLGDAGGDGSGSGDDLGDGSGDAGAGDGGDGGDAGNGDAGAGDGSGEGDGSDASGTEGDGSDGGEDTGGIEGDWNQDVIDPDDVDADEGEEEEQEEEEQEEEEQEEEEEEEAK